MRRFGCAYTYLPRKSHRVVTGRDKTHTYTRTHTYIYLSRWSCFSFIYLSGPCRRALRRWVFSCQHVNLINFFSPLRLRFVLSRLKKTQRRNNAILVFCDFTGKRFFWRMDAAKFPPFDVHFVRSELTTETRHSRDRREYRFVELGYTENGERSNTVRGSIRYQ